MRRDWLVGCGPVIVDVGVREIEAIEVLNHGVKQQVGIAKDTDGVHKLRTQRLSVDLISERAQKFLRCESAVGQALEPGALAGPALGEADNFATVDDNFPRSDAGKAADPAEVNMLRGSFVGLCSVAQIGKSIHKDLSEPAERGRNVIAPQGIGRGDGEVEPQLLAREHVHHASSRATPNDLIKSLGSAKKVRRRLLGAAKHQRTICDLKAMNTAL